MRAAHSSWFAARPLLLSVCSLLLAACSLAPKYEPPKLEEVPQHYKEAGNWVQSQLNDAQARSNWWSAFGDPQLDALQDRLHSANPDLRASLARFEQARAVAGYDRSAEFPAVSGTVVATRGRESTYAPVAVGAGDTGNDFIASLNVAWEIDLFGRLRNTTRAANQRAQASAAEFAALDLALQAQLATDYFSLRGDDAVARLLSDSLTQYDQAYEQTRRRYATGVAAATDVDQADTLRQNARAQLAATRLQRAQLEHAIAVLLGVPPEGFALAPAPLKGDPPPIGVGLSSTLLQRRPDVASAERAVAAANSEIGVARAAWFPVFSLQSAALGLESTAASTWIGAPARFWSVGPQAQVPLLDFGARSSINRQARAVYEEAVANYRKTALTAYQEVEDNLAALNHLQEELVADEAAAKSAQSSAYHADQRYAAGVADYVEVTTTHTAALAAQDAAILTRTARMNAAVSLVQALGGGWTPAQLDQPPQLNQPAQLNRAAQLSRAAQLNQPAQFNRPGL